jgi:hypothetical protein
MARGALAAGGAFPETGASRIWPFVVRRYSLVAWPQAKQSAE